MNDRTDTANIKTPQTPPAPETQPPAPPTIPSADQLARELAIARDDLQRLQDKLAHMEWTAGIDTELERMNTVDLEIARSLVERALASTPRPAADPAKHIARAVSDLKTQKPFLFNGPRDHDRHRPHARDDGPARERNQHRPSGAGETGSFWRTAATAPMTDGLESRGDTPGGIEALADEARQSGDRRALLRYLMAKRVA